MKKVKKGEKVYLNIYSLYNNNLIDNMGMGLYHTGVSVFGDEYTFGGGMGPGSGVISHRPRDIGSGATFIESIEIGTISLSYSDFNHFMHQEVKPLYPGNSYHLLHNNCNHFTTALCKVLVGDIGAYPSYINRPALVGSYAAWYCPSCLIPSQAVMTQQLYSHLRDIEAKLSQRRLNYFSRGANPASYSFIGPGSSLLPPSSSSSSPSSSSTPPPSAFTTSPVSFSSSSSSSSSPPSSSSSSPLILPGAPLEGGISFQLRLLDGSRRLVKCSKSDTFEDVRVALSSSSSSSSSPSYVFKLQYPVQVLEEDVAMQILGVGGALVNQVRG